MEKKSLLKLPSNNSKDVETDAHAQKEMKSTDSETTETTETTSTKVTITTKTKPTDSETTETTETKKVVYIDGIFDIFHRGHVESLRKAKEFFGASTYLIVGVISDEDATSYKRPPIYNEEDRYILVHACRYVDHVIMRAPLIINKEFVKKHKIDAIVHGFADAKDAEAQKKFYEEVQDIFYEIPYYKHISTSSIIKAITNSTKTKDSVEYSKEIY